MIYHLLRLFLKLLSYIPFGVLYFLADGISCLLYDVVRYRRKIVRRNLTESFPEKSPTEIRRIEHKFYRFFADMMLESCKLASLSQEEMKRRMQFRNVEAVNALLKEGKSVSIYLGHYGNWEWVSSMPLWLENGVTSAQIYHKLRNKNMEAFMSRCHEKGDLAPRDAVTRAIVTELKCGRGFGKRGDFVLLDCRNIPPERLSARLPELCDLTETALHIHPSTHLIPVIPTAHYFMGGVACDLDGRALDGIGFPVPGLYAAGECACTGVHGANRVGGNSLLETVVFGARAGTTAAAECTGSKALSPPPEATAAEAAASLNERLTPFLNTGENGRRPAETPLDCRRELKEIMSAYCGTTHTTVRHKQGAAKLALLNRRFARCRLKTDPGRPYNTELKDFLETENLLFLAEALFSAAEERSESIGAFCREDQLYAGATPYHTATEWRKGRFLTERRPL